MRSICTTLVVLWLPLSASGATARAEAGCVLVEAERFAEPGGWVVDQQFMDQMGSPYLLAHGLGEPVATPSTHGRVPRGRQVPRLGPHQAIGWRRGRRRARRADSRCSSTASRSRRPSAPKGAEWHWQDGGTVEHRRRGRSSGAARSDRLRGALRRDPVLRAIREFTPPNDVRRWPPSAGRLPRPAGTARRRRASSTWWSSGGGIAGTCAALSAARLGLEGGPGAGPAGARRQQQLRGARLARRRASTCRPIRASATSSRSWNPRSARTTARQHGGSLRGRAEARAGARREEHHAVPGAARQRRSDDARRAHRARSSPSTSCTGARLRLGGQLVRRLHRRRRGRRSWPARITRSTPKDTWARATSGTCKDTGEPAPFPALPVGAGPDRQAASRPERPTSARAQPKPGSQPRRLVLGKRLRPRPDRRTSSAIRDQNFRAMYGAWDALKNVDKVLPNHKLNWAAYIAGKRESRRLLGDVILTRDDFWQRQPVSPTAASPAPGALTSTCPTRRTTRASRATSSSPTPAHGDRTSGPTGRPIAASTAAISPTSSWPAATSASPTRPWARCASCAPAAAWARSSAWPPPLQAARQHPARHLPEAPGRTPGPDAPRRRQESRVNPPPATRPHPGNRQVTRSRTSVAFVWLGIRLLG